MIPELVDHLWQSTLFVAAAWVVTLGLRKNRAQVRYWVWLTASVKFLVPFAMLEGLGELAPRRAAVSQVQREWVAAVEQIGEPLAVLPSAGSSEAQTSRSYLVPLVLAVWACGFLSVAIVWLGRWRRVAALRKSATLLSTLEFPVPVMSAAGLVEPGIFGILRPVLLLPEGIEERLNPEQLSAILAHELCHVRRRDNLTATIHMIVQAMFWFHPLVWWIGSRLMDERERACDEEVLRLGNKPVVYAEGILNVCKLYAESPLACVSGVTGSDLKKRVEAIMKNRNLLRLSLAKKAALSMVAVVAIAVPIVVGVLGAQTQEPKQPLKSFEVASVRLADPRVPGGRGGMPPNLNGSRFEYVATIHSLIVRAYSLRGCKDCDLVVGGPGWIKNDMYRIEAKLPEGTPAYNFTDFDSGQAEGIYQMIQSLLADRLGLKMHREAKEVPVYALTVGPGGHKLTPTAGKVREYADGTTRLDHRLGMMPVGSIGPDGVQRVGMTVTDFTLQEFAENFLSNQFDRPVLDRTEVSGRFDFSMEFDADPPEPGRIMPTIGGPGLITGLSQQLGLRLQATKAPVDMLAIDSIQRPTDN